MIADWHHIPSDRIILYQEFNENPAAIQPKYSN